ncbi:class I SAM-dependent methyltransferase [Lutimonas sp.]|uniref:class I SAM-dependent methyltransferase n=1 Tax=Lutimonas sp. TaxID=1872403 RepID=UPI003D9B1D6D
MDENQMTFDAWNNVAAVYESQFMNLKLYDETYDLFLHVLRGVSAEVLEIGCGPGNISKYLIEKRPGLGLLGIDSSVKMLERARLNVPEASFEELDCRTVLSLKSQFAGIVCGFIIPYLSKTERKKLIADCSRLLVKHGILYLSFVHTEMEESQLLKDQKGNCMRFYGHNHLKVTEELRSNSFELLYELSIPFRRKDGSSEDHFVVIAKRGS